mgnify:CR=1 FL=1
MSKIKTFVKYSKFLSKIKIFVKVQNLSQNQHFCQQSTFLSTIKIFVKRFLSKIVHARQFFVHNQSFLSKNIPKKLQIENAQFLERIDTKNKELIHAKLKAGKAQVQLQKKRKELQNETQKQNRLIDRIETVKEEAKLTDLDNQNSLQDVQISKSDISEVTVFTIFLIFFSDIFWQF